MKKMLLFLIPAIFLFNSCKEDNSNPVDPVTPTEPSLVSPVNGDTNVSVSPTLRWNTFSGATDYSLQVSSDSSFSSCIYSQGGLTGTSQLVTGLSGATIYYWRVSIPNGPASLISSKIWKFTTVVTSPDKPTLSIPNNGELLISASPKMYWKKSSGADNYTLQISKDASFTSFVYNQSGITDTNQQITIGLSNSTKFYWRVIAVNKLFSTLSDVWSFTTTVMNVPCPGTPTVTYSGKTYNTVLIGNQCWLKENLDVGTRINGSEAQTDNGTIEKYCYDDNIANCNTYGGLYQWAEIVQYKNGATNNTSPNPAFTGNVQGICPTGWHIPTLTEFETLLTAVNNNCNALKAIGQGSGVGAGTNTSGFSALLAGYHGNLFNRLGDQAYFLSSTQYNTITAYYLTLYHNLDTYPVPDYKSSGYSARCLKDN